MAPTKSSRKPASRPPADTGNQQQKDYTTSPSTSSPRVGGDTLDQQRGHGANTLMFRTAAHTQPSVAGILGPEPQRLSANYPFKYPTIVDHRDLYGEGSQGSGTSGTQHEARTARMEEAFVCPYHGSVLQGHSTNAQPGQGLNPMDRYVAEGPSERYAILHRPDAGNGSTHNGCRCFELMQSGAESQARAQK